MRAFCEISIAVLPPIIRSPGGTSIGSFRMETRSTISFQQHLWKRKDFDSPNRLIPHVLQVSFRSIAPRMFRPEINTAVLLLFHAGTFRAIDVKALEKNNAKYWAKPNRSKILIISFQSLLTNFCVHRCFWLYDNAVTYDDAAIIACKTIGWADFDCVCLVRDVGVTTVYYDCVPCRDRGK